jgi:hypothetical protein
MPDDSYLTKQVEKELKSMKERKELEINSQEEKIINNFKENINLALISNDMKKIASLTNSFALYVNTLLDIKENKLK